MSETTSAFRVGQRVRIAEYPHESKEWGSPHFIVGHFGHIERFIGCGLIEVKLSRGPDGGKPDPRVFIGWDPGRDPAHYEHAGYWPMYEHELEAVD